MSDNAQESARNERCAIRNACDYHFTTSWPSLCSSNESSRHPRVPRQSQSHMKKKIGTFLIGYSFLFLNRTRWHVGTAYAVQYMVLLYSDNSRVIHRVKMTVGDGHRLTSRIPRPCRGCVLVWAYIATGAACVQGWKLGYCHFSRSDTPPRLSFAYMCSACICVLPLFRHSFNFHHAAFTLP